MTRHRLADRRAHQIIAIEHDGQRYKVGLGREFTAGAFGPVMEVFLDAARVDSPLDALVSDGAILMSLLLQWGCPAAEIHEALCRTSRGLPATPLGRAAALVFESSTTNQGD
jgi:hypothetical protein